jgi:hypothetical protein
MGVSIQYHRYTGERLRYTDTACSSSKHNLFGISKGITDFYVIFNYRLFNEMRIWSWIVSGE